jgi:hypothetical protein
MTVGPQPAGTCNTRRATTGHDVGVEPGLRLGGHPPQYLMVDGDQRVEIDVGEIERLVSRQEAISRTTGGCGKATAVR